MARTSSSDQPLANPRHERFAQLVVSGMAQGPAYLEAGFRGSEAAARANAARLITTDSVASRVAHLRSKALVIVQQEAEEAVASAAWIVRESVRLYERCMTDVPVRDKKGEETGEYTFDSGGANRALDRLAKRHPEFRDAAPVVEVKVLVVGESKL